MEFGLTENEKMIRDSVREFAEKELAPHFKRWDRTGEFPDQSFMNKIIDMGLLKLRLPAEYGGQGASFV